MLSVAYTPDGRYIISGSGDKTIRIWDTETGAAVGPPLEGHTSSVWAVACSPDGRRIASGSDDGTIRIWDVGTGTVVGEPLRVHTGPVMSVAYSPNGRHIISGSADTTIRIWDANPDAVVDKHHQGCTEGAQPDSEGWVRDSEGGLLYWVSPDYRGGLHSPALLTIPVTSRLRPVSLDVDDFAFGTSWVQIFNNA